MQPLAKHREVVSQGVQAKGTFGISLNDQAHIMTILRDTLYTDKVLAVLREYASNAWDAHREAGKGDVPITVVLPTLFEPTLIIRDKGTGLSEGDIFLVFTQYGASTKRDSNEVVGYLGIGGKAGFSYSDSFTITSWYGGMKNVYAAVLDESDVGEIHKLHEGRCGDRVGLEIKVPIRPKDISEFNEKARGLFAYFEPRPDINIGLPSDTGRNHKKHGFLNPAEEGWVAVMGCVPYRLALHQVKVELEEAGLWDSFRNLSGGLFLDIGAVQVNASREELKYSDYTKEAITTKFRQLLDESVEDLLQTLAADTITEWGKRTKARYAVTQLHLHIPDRYQDYNRPRVLLYGSTVAVAQEKAQKILKPKTFTARQYGTRTNSANVYVPVSPDTTVYIRDNELTLKGYGDDLSEQDVVVFPTNGSAPEKLRAELDKFLANAGLAGVPIRDISQLQWTHAPTRRRWRGGRTPNRKHHVSCFQLRDHLRKFSRPLSDNWDIVEREPADEDVFVILSHFVGSNNFYQHYRKDRQLAEAFNLTMPAVYGYKTTEKKPVKSADCQGIPYSKWRRDYFRRHLNTPETRALIRDWYWGSLFGGWEGRDLRRRAQEYREKFRRRWGSQHLVTRLLTNHLKGVKALREARKDKPMAVDHLLTIRRLIATKRVPAAHRMMTKVKETYPLLYKGVHVLTTGHSHLWMDYIDLVDRDAKENQ